MTPFVFQVRTTVFFSLLLLAVVFVPTSLVADNIPPPGDCKICGGIATVLPIRYGYPGERMFEAHRAGKLLLGGCVVSEESPGSKCLNCQRLHLAKQLTRPDLIVRIYPQVRPPSKPSKPHRLRTNEPQSTPAVEPPPTEPTHAEPCTGKLPALLRGKIAEKLLGILLQSSSAKMICGKNETFPPWAIECFKGSTRTPFLHLDWDGTALRSHTFSPGVRFEFSPEETRIVNEILAQIQPTDLAGIHLDDILPAFSNSETLPDSLRPHMKNFLAAGFTDRKHVWFSTVLEKKNNPRFVEFLFFHGKTDEAFPLRFTLPAPATPLRKEMFPPLESLMEKTRTEIETLLGPPNATGILTYVFSEDPNSTWKIYSGIDIFYRYDIEPEAWRGFSAAKRAASPQKIYLIFASHNQMKVGTIQSAESMDDAFANDDPDAFLRIAGVYPYDWTKFKTHVRGGYSITGPSSGGDNFLHLSAAAGKPRLVHLHLQKYLGVNTPNAVWQDRSFSNYRPRLPIDFAIAGKHLPVARQLLQAGSQLTPFAVREFFRQNQFELIREFKHAFDFENHPELLSHCITNAKIPEAERFKEIEFYFSTWEPVSAYEKRHGSILAHFLNVFPASLIKIQTLELLIKLGADPNLSTPLDPPPLFVVSTPEQALLLLQSGADPDKKDTRSSNPENHLTPEQFFDGPEEKPQIARVIRQFRLDRDKKTNAPSPDKASD